MRSRVRSRADSGIAGRDFTYNSESTFRYFASKGLNLFRVCLRWERLQPVLGGPLDAGHVRLLRENIAWAEKYGSRAIIDIHNYGRYQIEGPEGLREYAIDSVYDGRVRVSTADFANLWTRLSGEFRRDAGVWAYGLMCEPHDMGKADWKSISQAALTAIRQTGDDRLVLVPGDDWSSAARWVKTHGASGWIADPAGNFLYEAHLYFDSNESGGYTTPYDEELARDPDLAPVGRRRLRPFAEWCRANGVKGYLGEYGVPDRTRAGSTSLTTCSPRSMRKGSTERIGPRASGGATIRSRCSPGETDADRPQTAVLERHPGDAFA